ncbi:MAG: MBL fold metallo-hydrolase, partial [Gammaproteobacteria bacterium]|nr:MBL fold metallo-hydrolase [Gammaproteobacteria bacterium]
GEFLQYCFSDFDFENIRQTLPTRTFDDNLQINCGDKDVMLKRAGPCHTRGDILVHVPADRLMFTGDILFIEGHPILWAGPVGNWIGACDYMLGLDLETIVPGHGPITDHRGVRAVRDYLVYVRDEARKRFDAGLTVYDAAMDISMTDYDAWGDGERIVVNVATLYREFGDSESPANPVELFTLMAKLHKTRRR